MNIGRVMPTAPSQKPTKPVLGFNNAGAALNVAYTSNRLGFAAFSFFGTFRNFMCL